MSQAAPVVLVVRPSSANPVPTVRLKSTELQIDLTPLLAVRLAGDLLEGAGQLLPALSEDEQREVAQMLMKLFRPFYP